MQIAHAQASAHQNAFNLLRIIAALAVIFSHQFPVTATQPPLWLNSNMVGGVAVMTFFTISGYLVMLSWLRQPRFLLYAGKRLLRLWPGMLVAVVVGALVLGPVFTSLPVQEFLVHPATFDHWRNLLLVKAYENLPGVFSDNPLAGLMNGPLWTIPMELLCYAVLGVAGMIGLLRWRPLATVIGLSYLAFFLTQRNADLTGTMRHWFEYPAYFVYGSLIALYGNVFATHGSKLLLALAPVAAALFFWAKLEHSAGLLFLPPLLIFLGLKRGTLFTWLHRTGDPSYGIYVLGCPIEQVVQALLPEQSFVVRMLLAMAFSIAAGYVSWHAVEAPAMRLKRWLS